MNDIKKLINYISKQKLKQVQIITDKPSFKGKSKVLYDSILNGDINTDDQAIKKLYGDDEKEKGKGNYRKLKYRLRQRLLNTLFVIDINDYDREQYIKGEVNLIKTWAATEILAKRRLATLSRQIQSQILKTAIKFDNLKIALSIASDQRRRYSSTEYNQKTYEKYNILTNSLLSQYVFQLKTSEYYTKLVTIVGHKAKYTDEELTAIRKNLFDLRKELSVYKNFTSSFYLFNAIFYLGMIDNDFELKKSICEQALEYLKEFPQAPKVMYFSFNQKRALLYLEEGKHELALSIFKELLKLKIKPGGLSWQFVRNYISLVHFTEYNYKEAYKVVANIINNKKAFDRLNSIFKEHWYIKEAYLSFLIAAGKLDTTELEVTLKRPFRIKRFVNEVPQPSKDKVGYNLSIILIQFYFILLHGDIIKISEKLDSLKQYSFRYLKGKDHIRARTYIKLLQKLRNPLLGVKEINRKSRSLLKTLNDNPHDYSVDVMERESIPYNQQWSELISLIDTKKLTVII